MHFVIPATVGLVVGVAIGTGFFGGLWWTAHRLVTARRPAVLAPLSLLTRMAALALVLALMGSLGPAWLLGALAGVVAARVALTRPSVLGRLPVPTPPGDAEH